MLSLQEQLHQTVVGRYASDAELQALQHYVDSYSLRLQTYQALQQAETAIVQAVYEALLERDAALLQGPTGDFTAKWRQDTLRVYRYGAVALLLDDPHTLQERFLLWFQTVMQAFAVQDCCSATYEIMQRVVIDYLPPSQASLFCPLLVLTRGLLSQSSTP